jgi:hypothetical protein
MFSLNQSQNTLKQVKVTVTLPQTNKKYTGNPRSEIVEVTPADAVYSIKDSQGNKIKTNKGNATLTGAELNMGVNNGANATYSIHPLGDENYTYVLDNQQFVTGTLTIESSTITIASSGLTSFVYNGSTRTIGYTVSGVSNADPNYDVSVKSAINAGSYTAALSENSTNYTLGSPSSFTWTITPSVITIASSGLTSFVYNGSTRTIGYTVSGVHAADTNYDVSAKSAINAGSYTAALSEYSTNYTLGSPSSFTWTITKAVLTLTTGNNSMTYGSSVPTQSFGYSLSGFLGGDTTSVISGSAIHSTTATSSSNVGSYPITTSGLSAANYTFSAINGTLTINPATLTATITSGSATFNGESQTVTVIGGINGTYWGILTAVGTNVGPHTTTITGNNNYTGDVTGTLTIIPATITFQGTGESRTYNRATQSIPYIVGGAARNNYNYTITGTSGINAGTYTARITTAYSNYVISPTFNSFTWTIHQDVGHVNIYQGGVYDAGHTAEIVLPVASSYSAFEVVVTDVIGWGKEDAEYTSSGYSDPGTYPYSWNLQYSPRPPGVYVRNKNPQTLGFEVRITVQVSDPNYTFMSASTSIRFNAYSAPSGDGGFVSE